MAKNYKEILITYIQLFITGCVVITIRNFNKIVGLGNIRKNFIKNKAYPPPVALSFGIWFYQNGLKKRINKLVNEQKSFINLLPVVIYITLLYYGINYLL